MKTETQVATLKMLEMIRSAYQLQCTEMHQTASYTHEMSTTTQSCPHSCSKIMNNVTICNPNSRPKLEARSQCDVHSSPFLHWSPIPLLFLWTVLLPATSTSQPVPAIMCASHHVCQLPYICNFFHRLMPLHT